MMNRLFDIHADDYAISENSDKTILDLCSKNKLDSLSFIPNLSYAEKAAEKLIEMQGKRVCPVLVSVHINFVEGHSCTPKADIPDLVDENGLFTVTWEKLFIWNYLPSKRSAIRKQLKSEIIAQTERLISLNVLDINHLRFDSHMHTHMIPLVFDALLDAIKEKNWSVDFIRNTEDPIHYYAGPIKLYKSYSLVNIIKCLILNFFSITKVRPALKKRGLSPSLMCGVFFSGKMNKDRLPSILPVFAKKSQKKQRISEILFHPCLMKSNEITNEFNKEGINDFHLSPNRMIEYDAALSIDFTRFN